MKKHYFTRVLLASLCVTSTLQTVAAADVAASANEVQIQRSFVNLSFNQPALSGTYAQLSESQVEVVNHA
jgi:endonuclease/exonuclease/phosphatase (EEP) superfamily protein YafD